VRAARALSVASIALALSGCAQQRVEVEPAAPRGAVVAPRGLAVAVPARAGGVIAAPPGTIDPQSRDVAVELARRTGFSLLIIGSPVEGARPEVAGAFEQRVRDAARTPLVRDAGAGTLAFYAEIHRARLDSPRSIEITTTARDAGLAGRLRTLFELIRDAHLRSHARAPRLDVLVTTGDEAGARDGLPRALKLALPPIAGAEAREPYLTILADFLAQAATLPAGR